MAATHTYWALTLSGAQSRGAKQTRITLLGVRTGWEMLCPLHGSKQEVTVSQEVLREVSCLINKVTTLIPRQCSGPHCHHPCCQPSAWLVIANKE